MQKSINPGVITGMRDYASKWPAPVIAGLFVFAWLAATSWMRPLALPDEGRYVGVAWEMARSGDWLVPTLDTLPYFHKPPLFYWVTAGAIWLFGPYAWAARLPTVLAATGAAMALFVFLRRWVNERTGRIAVLVLVTMPFFFGGSQFANMDMLVAFCICLSIFCAADVVLALKHGRPSQPLALGAAYLFAALGLLAKGLIGIVIPAIVIGSWLIAMQQPRLLLKLLSGTALMLFLAIAVPWFWIIQVRYPGFLDYFFVHHHVQRFLTGDFNGHRAFWFYVPVFAAVTLPWSAFLPWAVRGSGEDLRIRDLQLLLWIWLVSVLIFFSIPQSKLLGYVLPATPALAGLVALAIVNRAGTYLGSRRNVASNAIAGAVVGLAIVVGYAIHYRHDISRVARKIRTEVEASDHFVAIKHYPFSLSFYLHSMQPITVVDDWDPALVGRDSWRKELYEAAKFDPARGAQLLLKHSDLGNAFCDGRTWIFSAETTRAGKPGVSLSRSAPDGC